MNNEILAVVAGQNITEEDYNYFVQSMPREQQQYAADPRFKEQCLEQLISVHLFAKKGEELKLEETEEFAKIIANAKRDILAQMAMREVLGGITVTEEEMQAHYEANKQAYSKGETVSAKHILVPHWGYRHFARNATCRRHAQPKATSHRSCHKGQKCSCCRRRR